MRLILDFNGAQLVGNNLQQIVDAAGINASIVVNTAQAAPIATLLAVIQVMGSKNFSASFNGAQLVSNNLQQAVAAAGAGTKIGVNTAQSAPIATLLAIIREAGSKNFSASFNGAQLVSNNLQQAVAAAGANTSISVNTAQAVPIAILLAVIQAAGSKNFSTDFNGDQLSSNNLQQIITAAGANTSISVGTAQAIPIATLLSAIQAAGSKKFSADFDGDQLSSNNLQQAITVAGANTSISVGTAQATPIATLLSAVQTAGSKNFSASFNGAQLVSNNLQQVVAVAGTNTTISVNAAHAAPLATLLAAIAIAG